MWELASHGGLDVRTLHRTSPRRAPTVICVPPVVTHFLEEASVTQNHRLGTNPRLNKRTNGTQTDDPVNGQSSWRRRTIFTCASHHTIQSALSAPAETRVMNARAIVTKGPNYCQSKRQCLSEVRAHQGRRMLDERVEPREVGVASADPTVISCSSIFTITYVGL